MKYTRRQPSNLTSVGSEVRAYHTIADIVGLEKSGYGVALYGVI